MPDPTGFHPHSARCPLTVRWCRLAQPWLLHELLGGNVKRKKSETTEAVAPTYSDLVQTAADESARSRRRRLTGWRRPRGGWGRSPTTPPESWSPSPTKRQTGSARWRSRRGASSRRTPSRPLARGRPAGASRPATPSGPYALLAKQRGAQAAQDVIEKWRPALEEAMEKVAPGVEAAKDRINEDLLPKLVAALEAAAAAPVVVEAGKRGQATLAAARGELTLPEPKPKRRWLKRVLIIAVVGGVIVVVARSLLGGQDADWQAARPTAPYAPPKPPTPAAPASNGQTRMSPRPPSLPKPSEPTPESTLSTEADVAAVPEDASAEQSPEEATAVDGAAPGEPEPVTEQPVTERLRGSRRGTQRRGRRVRRVRGDRGRDRAGGGSLAVLGRGRLRRQRAAGGLHDQGATSAR